MERDIIIYLRASEGDRNKQTHIHEQQKIHLEGESERRKVGEGLLRRGRRKEEKKSTGLGDAVDAR